MYLTYESLTWCIDGVRHAAPSVSQLAALVPGRDYAMLAPSKPDQWGEIHCPYPVVLTFYAEPGNAAAALRDLELQRHAHFASTPRNDLPLFHDSKGRPFTHAFLSGMLRDALTHCFGPQVASLYTWHSYRSGLATALHAAGVDDGMIMLICRWMSPESLHVYRRMGTAENEQHTRRAMAVNVDLIQTTNVPKVMGDQGYAELFNAYGNMPEPPDARTLANLEPSLSPRPVLNAPPNRHCPLRRHQAQCNAPPVVVDTPPATAAPRARIALRPARLPVHPTCDAGSTTGVGRIDHRFPASLDGYRTYDERPSKRRMPTPRSRSQWQRVS